MDYRSWLLSLGFTEEDFSIDLPLSEKTRFKIGGPADVFLAPAHTGRIPSLLKEAHKAHIPVSIFGDGSNLLVRDRGVRGVTLSLAKTTLPDPLFTDEGDGLCRFSAGTLMENAVMGTCNRGYAGMERLFGLPGTLGGALYMNACCYDCEIADVFIGAEGFDLVTGERRIVAKSAGEWNYKKSPFQTNAMLIETVRLKLTPGGDSAALVAEALSYKQDREAKGHFRYPCAGSVFKNNRDFGAPSGKIIDNAGLRNARVGGAAVSSFHANIIVNLEHASASDVETLIANVQTKVKTDFGFDLEPEVIVIGE